MVFMLGPVVPVSTVLSVVVVCIVARLVGDVLGLTVCIVSAVYIAPDPCYIVGRF